MHLKDRWNSLPALLSLGLSIPLLLGQLGCSMSPAKDKAANQVPEISSVTFSDLKTSTKAWPTETETNLFGNTWTITAGSTTYLRATFGAIGGSAILTPGNTRLVSAVPISLSPAATTTYTVTVTDDAGHTTTKSATLTVIPAVDPTLTAPTSAIANQASLTASVPPYSVSGVKYTWSADNATITSGATTPSITFTAGSANSDGSAKNMTLKCEILPPTSTLTPVPSSVTIPVLAVAPSGLSYASPNPTYYQDVRIQANVPTVQGAVQNFTVSPVLPDGLSLDPVHGMISGIPTAVKAAAPCTVTASNSGGMVSVTLNIQVQAQPTVDFNTPMPAKIGPGGNSILSWNTTSEVTAISITAVPSDPTLPSTFAVGNGTANVSPSQTTVYTLTATLQGGGQEPPKTQTVVVDATPLAFATNLSASPAGTIAFGGGTTLNWGLSGTANSLTLNSPATEGAIPVSTTGSTFAINPVLRRQTYQLTASNGAGTVKSQAVTVAAQGLDTLAGNIIQGGGSHDGTGTAAQFNAPQNIALDPDGNIYVPDTNNHIIRLITPQGAVTTLAGISGVPGSTDGVPGLQAQFNSPRGVAYWRDPANGNAPYLFVADTNNQVIRKITLSTTTPITATNVLLFAGQMGTYGTGATQLDGPESLVIDGNGNMYCAEYYNDIVKVTGLGNTTGTFITYAGSRGAANGYLDDALGTARFYQPNAIALDASGNLYITENGGNRVRKITPTAVSTLAGDSTGVSGFVDGPLGTSRLSAPAALAISKDGSTLYIGDTKNNAVRGLNLGTNTLVTLIGSPATGSSTPGTSGNTDGQGTSALLGGPQGLALDLAGNLFIAEANNNDIRKADPGLNVSTFAGSAPLVGHADGPLGIGELAISPGLSTNNTMAGMVVDGSNNLYVADVYNNAIRMITPAGEITTIAGTAGLSTAGNADGSNSSASFNRPNGLARDAAGNLYVADTNNSIIRQLTWDTTNKIWNVVTIAGIPLTTGAVDGPGVGTATFKFPYGIVASPDGNLYVADSGNGKLRKLTPSNGTWTVSTLTITGITLKTPMGLAADATGNLYVAERYNYFVAQLAAPVSPATTWMGQVIGGLSGSKGFADGAPGATKATSSLFNQPQGLSLDASGNLWVADTSNHVVRKITNTAGVWTTSSLNTSSNINAVGKGILSTTTTAVPLGTSVGGFGSATVFLPQAVVVSPSGHDLFITTNGGVAQATSIDGQ